MIVYGDPSYEQSMGVLVERLRLRLAMSLSSSSTLDVRRTLLVQAGQLEQAVADRSPHPFPLSVADQCRRITDAAADAFLNEADPRPLGEMLRALRELPRLCDPAAVKIPEGFAFYALFPEAYREAARRWRADRGGDSFRAAVIGVRSIGTTLSAVVAATLRAEGGTVWRATLRPGGHPFAREAAIEPEALGGAEWALIVDEGPGLSGSSMAAAAEAACRAGIARDRIAFFPGHGGEPGAQASEAVRRWWSAAPRYVAPTEALRWNGRSLDEALAETVVRLGSSTASVAKVEDLSGGAWREKLFADPAEWPPVVSLFERSKVRVTLSDGTAVLWKYEGLAALPSGEDGARAARELLAKRSAAGWSPAPLAAAYGYVATEWIEGEPLRRSDGNPAVLAQIGRYLAAVAGSPLEPADREAARRRLAEMLYWNVREVFGEETAARLRDWAPEDEPGPTYGDGRLAPHEWRRTPSGRLVKTDGVGHDRDHTVVGPQSVLWDVAGAIVEWDLDDAGVAALLAGSPEWNAASLPFYRLAYAAFRMGFCVQGAAMTSDEAERARLDRAAGFYRRRLAQEIGCAEDAP